jgi:hypothetical protein
MLVFYEFGSDLTQFCRLAGLNSNCLAVLKTLRWFTFLARNLLKGMQEGRFRALPSERTQALVCLRKMRITFVEHQSGSGW